MSSFLMAGAVLFSLGSPPMAPDDVCRCTSARLKNGWCGYCKVGYVAGLKIKSAMLFEELDAHGHNIDPAKIECRGCQKALASDGYCQRCRYGFVNKQLYFSQLSYYLAKGQTRDAAQLTCKTCTQNAARYGWCPACQMGMVGNVAYKKKNDFNRAVAEYDKLVTAIARSKRCEMCAVVMYTGGKCPECKKAPPTTGQIMPADHAATSDRTQDRTGSDAEQ